jgi:hypothetical protein
VRKFATHWAWDIIDCEEQNQGIRGVLLRVPFLERPFQSPDLYPIEILWSILDVNLKDRKPQNEAQHFDELKIGW